MYAKLIIYQQEPPANPDWQASFQTGNHSQWELTADNLTTGKVAELLLCLDELGFSDKLSTITEPS